MHFMVHKMTPKQLKAARALLGWTQRDLSKRSKVAMTSLADFERGVLPLNDDQEIRIINALKKARIDMHIANFRRAV